MNLRHKTSSEAKTQEQPWYHQPEAVLQAPPQTAPQESQTQPHPAPAPAQQRFEPETAERIIARAGLLQETHRQTLSREQIEAIAAEVGIQPEFVHRAMEQETAGVVSPQTETLNHETASSAELLARQRLATIAVSFGAIAGYGLKSVILLALSNHYHSDLIMPILFVLPAFLALALGLISRSRRGGAVSGAALAVTVIAAALLSMWQTGGRTTLGSTDFQIFALMIGGGALLGAAGAQTRRVVSRRLARNRSRRTIVRPGAS